ncbi:MAG: ferritin [Candidatus Omnitrophica bacterium]|nr:ferritin [Candidatus Omnitrophota bacterium]
MLTKKMEKLLNKQIVEEYYSSNLYLAMSSWCKNQGLNGSANFMLKQAEEERQHMLKLYHYVNESGGHAIVPALEEPPVQFKSLGTIYEQAMQHEQHITQCISNLVTASWAEKDYATFNFLQWYVEEQHEEEAQFQGILDLVKLAGLDGRGLYLVDKQVGKLAEKKS